VLLAGVGMTVGGVFRTDPGLGYPPGTQSGHSASGTVHDVAGGIVFACLILAAALLGRSLRAAPRAARWTAEWAAPLGYLVASVAAASFIACSVLVALDYAGTVPHAPSGLFERVALFAGLGWLAAVAGHLLRGPVR
jgi:hypothetical protein